MNRKHEPDKPMHHYYRYVEDHSASYVPFVTVAGAVNYH